MGNKIRSYFRNNFFAERLTANPDNKNLIKQFKAPGRGYNLEWYLQKKAWSNDLEGETKVYLIKDNEGALVAFFSIKCGLLYDNKEYQKLQGDEMEFVSLVFEQYMQNSADKATAIQSFYEYFGHMEYKRKEQLVEIAIQKSEDFNEIQTSRDGNFMMRVHETYSAVEIAHFCKNINYIYDASNMRGIYLGSGLFWEQIIPKIQEAINIVGCRYLYLFAADNSEYEDVRSLIRYYKYAFKFDEIQDLMILKPDYDSQCQAMIHEISEIENDRISFWAEYE